MVHDWRGPDAKFFLGAGMTDASTVSLENDTATTVRALDVIAAEYREAVEAERCAKVALSDTERSLRAALDTASNRMSYLRQELYAAALGRTVDEEQKRWASGV